jgi:hypothetical protein
VGQVVVAYVESNAALNVDAGTVVPESVPIIGRSSSACCTGALKQISAESGELIM